MFQVAPEVLVEGYDPVDVTLDTSESGFLTIKTSNGIFMKTSLEDYITQFGQNDQTIALVNSRNMLNVEELREKAT